MKTVVGYISELTEGRVIVDGDILVYFSKPSCLKGFNKSDFVIIETYTDDKGYLHGTRIRHWEFGKTEA